MNVFGVTQAKYDKLLVRMKACKILESDLDESFVRSSGPGGQHVNKTSTCVMLKHVPTSVQVKSQRSRSQLLNRYYARIQICEILEEKLYGKLSPEQKRIAKLRKQKQRKKKRSSDKYSKGDPSS